jgi:hypothetical protein
MDGYLRAHEKGTPLVAVRYEDLVDQRIQILSIVFDALGLPLTQSEQVLQAFEQHSQLDVSFDGRDQVKISEDEMQAFTALLEKHPRKLSTCMVLPDTLRPLPK